jgi:hypothetical protein
MDHASFAGDVSLIDAGVGWLSLRSATARSIDLSDLSGATGSELQLQGLNWQCRQATGTSKVTSETRPKQWPLGDPSWRTAECNGTVESLPRLILRNMHIESFQDDRNSWPPVIELEGLRYDRLGGAYGEGSADMRQRTPAKWIDWLARDRTFSSQPYTELANVLMTAGRRDTAGDILFAGRERERYEIWRQHDFRSWIWLSILPWVFGYGIGVHTFLVVAWLAGLASLGWVILWFSPYARQRGRTWRIFASLHRLLPIVDLGKEFKDFFDNTKEPGMPLKLHGWQILFFAVFAYLGWVLAFFLVAAMGGLIPK